MLYYTMPYISGESLASRLANSPRFSVAVAVELARGSGGRAGLRAPAGRGASRHQARERAVGRWARGRHGLRHRARRAAGARRRWGPHPDRLHPRHADVHESGAGERGRHRRPERRLRARLCAARDARRRAPVHGLHDAVDPGAAPRASAADDHARRRASVRFATFSAARWPSPRRIASSQRPSCATRFKAIDVRTISREVPDPHADHDHGAGRSSRSTRGRSIRWPCCRSSTSRPRTKTTSTWPTGSRRASSTS